MYKTGISVMGVEAVYLPFRLAGIIFYTRTIFIPTLLLLYIWQSERVGWYSKSLIGFILLILHGFTETVLRASKGGIFLMLLPVGFLFLTGNIRIRRIHLLLLSFSILIAAIIYPIAYEYRLFRINNPEDIFFALSRVSNILYSDFSVLLKTLKYGVENIFMRISGVELLVIYNGKNIQPLGWNAWAELTHPDGLAHYVTFDIFGFPSHIVNSIAPGIIGWFYLIGGNAFVILGLAGFTFITYILWKILLRMKLRSLQVAQALFLSFLFLLATDGVMERLISLPILVYLTSIWICEWFMRLRAWR
jgi:hypothetical protein